MREQIAHTKTRRSRRRRQREREREKKRGLAAPCRDALAKKPGFSLFLSLLLRDLRVFV
jgi:hypothetical protein